MERMPPLEPPYTPEVGDTLASMMPPGMEPLRLFRTLANNPRVLKKIRSSNLLDRGSLDRMDRELVILRTTARCGSEYEWGVHVAAFAHRFGISPETIEATVLRPPNDPAWSGKEGLLVRVVDELHDHSTLSEGTWNEVVEQYAAEQIVELLVLAGFYHTISFVTNALGVEHEPMAARFPDE